MPGFQKVKCAVCKTELVFYIDKKQKPLRIPNVCDMSVREVKRT